MYVFNNHTIKLKDLWRILNDYGVAYSNTVQAVIVASSKPPVKHKVKVRRVHNGR